MIDQKYLKVIQKISPDVSESDIKVFDQGWDYLVLLVKNQVFRFPKREKRAKRLPVESKFLSQFSSSPVAVPKMTLHTDPELEWPYATYPFINGLPFKVELMSNFSKVEVSNIALKLGEFLKVLHSFPVERIKELTEYSFDALQSWQERLENIKRVVFPHISETEQQWIERLFSDFFEMFKKSQIKKCVTHSDLHPEHIIVDNGKLSGIIDFGDILIGDPAYDFSYLGKYGQDFLQKVYQ